MARFSKEGQPTRRNIFTSENQPANRGRRPKLKSIPPDARERILEVLWHALTLPDQKTAQEYLSRAADGLPKYGYLVQCYAKGMMGKNSILYISDILDRLFGKPKQVADITADIGTGEAPVIIFRDTSGKVEVAQQRAPAPSQEPGAKDG